MIHHHFKPGDKVKIIGHPHQDMKPYIGQVVRIKTQYPIPKREYYTLELSGDEARGNSIYVFEYGVDIVRCPLNPAEAIISKLRERLKR